MLPQYGQCCHQNLESSSPTIWRHPFFPSSKYKWPTTFHLKIFFKYLRICSALSWVPWTKNLFLWHLIKFYNTEKSNQKGISRIYKLLTASAPEHKSPAMLHWENTLHCNYTYLQWISVLQRPLKTSQCITHWETTQKILNNWHLTPSKLARIYPPTLNACWRTCGNSGSSLHIWWTCPQLKPFWNALTRLLSSILRTSVSLSPQLVLLVLGLDSWPPTTHTVLTHVLIATRLAIVRKWKFPDPPSIKEVILLLNNHCLMEFMFAKAHGTLGSYTPNAHPCPDLQIHSA